MCSVPCWFIRGVILLWYSIMLMSFGFWLEFCTTFPLKLSLLIFRFINFKKCFVVFHIRLFYCHQLMFAALPQWGYISPRLIISYKGSSI